MICSKTASFSFDQNYLSTVPFKITEATLK